MVTRERLLAITLTLIMVTAAGCAGWGTDDPADDQDQDQGNGDDLEEADGEAQADGGNGSDGSSSGANDSDTDTDSNSSQDSSPRASDTDTADDSVDSKETDTTVGDQDESTAETDQTGNGDTDSSTDSGSDGDTDSDSDSDTGDGDTDQDDGDEGTVEETERTLKVTVVDEDGNPIEGASVHATGPVLSNGVAHEPADETNANGVAMLTAYDGEYDVEAQHDGTTTDKKTVVVDGDTEATITIDTSSDEDPGDGDDDAPYGTLTVTVEDGTNEPVKGVEVIGIGPEGETYSAITDTNGQAAFDLSDGEYTFYVSTDGTEYADSSEEEIPMDGSDQSITLTVQADDGGDGDQDPETHTLEVTVSDHNDNPLSDATVSVATDPGTESGEEVGSTTTDENGLAEFEVTDGVYEVSARHDDYESAEVVRPVNVEGEDTSVDVTMTEPNSKETNELTVNLANDDVDGVEIVVQRTGGPDVEPEEFSKASAGGQASFNLEPGHYYADAEGYVGTLSSIDVTEDDVEITLQNRSGATVPIKVTDTETDEPIEGAEIDGTGACQLNYSTGEVDISGTTGEDGIAQAHADVTPAWCTGVRISADDYEDQHVDINVPVEDPVQVELTPAENGNGGDDPAQCSTFDSYEEAQSHFEEAPLDRGHLDGDNDGVACEGLDPSPDAKAIVIIEDQNGERVADHTLTIDGEEATTNENGVASRGYDFHNGTGSKEVTVVVQDEERTMTVAMKKGEDHEEGSNIIGNAGGDR